MSAHPDGKTFIPCTRRNKCTRCGKASMCSRTADGAFEICYRVGTEEGLEKTGRLGTYWVYRTDNAPVRHTKIEHDLGGGELASPDELDRVYRDLLRELTLGDGHRGQLQARGMNDEQIARFGFRSWEAKRTASLADMLYKKHGDLCARIPGWYLRDQRPWLACWPGILIPIFDLADNVIAIHVRRDLQEGDDGPRYVWMSSANHDGPSPGSQPYLCFPKGLYKKGEQVEFPETWLVEGEFKAIAVSEKTGKAAVSIPGVSLYGLALPMLESVKARRIFLALDADWSDNRFVAQAILRAWITLRERGYDITVVDWPLDAGKGIDDVMQAGHRVTQLHDRECWSFLARVAKATGLYEHGITSKRGLPRFIPAVSPTQARKYLEAYTPGVHNPYEADLLDAYILSERSDPILRNNVRDSIKRKLSPIKDWDDAVAGRKKLLDQFTAWDRLQREKADPEKQQQAPDQLFPQAPLPVGYRIPDAYRVDEGGVHRLDFTKGEDGDPVIVCRTPAFPTARLQDIALDAHSLCLSWWRDGAWKHKVFSQTQLASTREIVQLADNDFPVDSENAGEIIAYLRDSRENNLDVLPRVQVTSHIGWQGREGEHGFLVGLQRARPDGQIEGTERYDLAPGRWGPDQLVFRGHDKGDDQAVSAYRAEGTLAGWLQAIEPVINYPRVLLLLYASFAAPLLEILKAPPFTVDLSYTTSAGKTTALRVAASIWGTPDERDPNPVIRSWENTRVFVERSLAMCNGLPLIMDDTARAANSQAIAKVVYDVSSGSGKGRGSKTGGISPSGSWRTILLSTGEQKITNFAELGGAHTRAVCIWGPPFNKQSAEAGSVVSQLHRGVLANHGHAGPVWVAWLLQQRANWPAWRDHYRAIQEGYSAQAGDNAVANRFSEYFAVLMLTSILVHEAIHFPWEAPKDPFRGLREDILHEAQEADRAGLAREFILGWIASQPQAFWNKRDMAMDGTTRPQQPPPGGWLGRWDHSPGLGQSRHDFVAIFPHHLKTRLEQAGYHYETTLRTWRDRGWLEHEADRVAKSVRVDRVKSKMVCLKAAPEEPLQ